MKRTRILLIMLALALALTGCAGFATPPAPSAPADTSSFEINFIDVGQADAALIMCDGHYMMIDGGNVADSDLIYAFLKDKGVSQIDYLVCTHAHEDHVGGLPAALHESAVSNAYSPVDDYNSRAFRNYVKAVEEQGLTLSCPPPGSSFSLGSATVEVLGPLREYEETNDTSIVLKITYGETKFLFTGDMERDAEQDLIDAGVDLSADVLKVGHHGSNTSSSYVFIRAVAPGYGIISCGVDNDYGHPHEEPLSRYRDAEVKLWRTDMQGTITCTSDGESVTFSTEKGFDIETNPTSAGEGTYIGNKNSKTLHLPTCSSLPAEKNQVMFHTLEEAFAKGYKECGYCMK